MKREQRLKSAPPGNPGGQQREPPWLIVLAWLAFGCVFALTALVYLSELAPRWLAPLQPWIHSFLFG